MIINIIVKCDVNANRQKMLIVRGNTLGLHGMQMLRLVVYNDAQQVPAQTTKGQGEQTLVC